VWRAARSVLVFMLIVVLGLAFGVLILTGISSQSGSLTGHLQDAADEIQGWLEDLGVNAHTAQSAKDDAGSSVSDGFSALIDGLETGNQRARVAGGVPRFHRAQPLLPGQGRATDQGLGRAPSRRSRGRGEHDR
jgi:hypothetical protein